MKTMNVETVNKIDPLAAAKARGLKVKQQLLDAQGGVISVRQVAELLRSPVQTIDDRRSRGQLIALFAVKHSRSRRRVTPSSARKRGYLYPVWQFAEGGLLPGLESVLGELQNHDPWMQVAFMVNANTRLNDESPLALLQRGEVEAVCKAAREYGEQGAV